MWKIKTVSVLVSLLLVCVVAGCSGMYTVMNHPEVEIKDDATGKFMNETVSVGSNCQSCHAEKTTAGYDYYAKNFNAESLQTTHDASSQLPAQGQVAEFQRGHRNYANDNTYGYYYEYPWWFDNSFFSASAYNVMLPNGGGNPVKRTRQNYRRGSGIQRDLIPPALGSTPVSTPMPAATAPAASSAKPAQSSSTSAPPSNTNTTRTRDSGKDDESSKKRDSGQSR